MISIERARSPLKEVLDRSHVIMTLDGSTTAGKTVVANALAERFGLTTFDTGLTIRTLALLAIEQKIVKTDEANVTRIPTDFADQIASFYDQTTQKIRIERPIEGSHAARVMVGERDMLGELLTYPKPKAIDNLSAVIAASSHIREKLYRLWREAVPRLGGTIVIGRKTGVDLFPGAQVKLYLYASPEASAEYRVNHDPWSQKKAESEERYIRERDTMDMESGLLDRPHNALILDTSSYIKDAQGLARLESRIAAYINSRYVIR